MPADAPRVSVVFATRDRPQRLHALLTALEHQTLPRDGYEVVAVDDGSGPENRHVLQAAIERDAMDLRVIWRERSGGPAVARNDGWRTARAPLVAFTDDDCVVAGDWLEEGLRMAEAHPDAILQGPVSPVPEELPRLTYFHHTFSNDACGPWYETANIFYPREVLERFGGFDESFAVPGGEDTDLAWRALAAGVRTLAVPRAAVHHAVVALGPLGKLRRANRWSDTVRLFADHPGLRAHLTHRVFWAPTHYGLVRTALALCLPRRWWPLKLWLAGPYLVYVARRRSGPLLAPYIVLHDVVELQAVLRGAVRHRTLVI